MATTDIPTASKDFEQLYSANVFAKIWGVAQRALSSPSPPLLYPEYTKPGGVEYVYRELDFWTSGFFPASLYQLLERRRRHAQKIRGLGSSSKYEPHELQLQFACKWWTENLHKNAELKYTHDLGFMIASWARVAWELENDSRAYDTVITAARSLASRYNPLVGCIRSWDTCVTKRYSFRDPEKDFLVIVDNLMNLDMLFWVAARLKDDAMYAVALNHAKLSQRCHVRADSSTAHVVNFDQASGDIKSVITNQGYADDSCWSRGQAWAITGFVQTYKWTKDDSFLETAKSCADYFIGHLPESGIPPWDFQAPQDEPQPTDTSAAVIASYGLLLIHEAETSAGRPSAYLQHALRIIRAVCASYVNSPAKFVAHEGSVEAVELRSVDNQKTVAITVDMGEGAETILNGATINNYEFAPRRWANHGLVYADYFFVLVGNKLLDMGIGEVLVTH
ncbi:glycoside hydrolase family 88 protein [Hypoxylon rubiginosum]|uniref:Glycoside hydrolase family 88 protein n=1 Tax=Hypoxylon rubiginosum TaxID=110542 RepID=A0ACC0D3L7_9PEZI|nr:glycoside hydrolase family 88 protein [Hypoxylon rubiginosum]